MQIPDRRRLVYQMVVQRRDLKAFLLQLRDDDVHLAGRKHEVAVNRRTTTGSIERHPAAEGEPWSDFQSAHGH